MNPVCLTYFTFLDMVFDLGFGPRNLGFRRFELAIETAIVRAGFLRVYRRVAAT